MIPRKAVIESIECLQEELDLVDIWRVKNPDINIISLHLEPKFTCKFLSPRLLVNFQQPL